MNKLMADLFRALFAVITAVLLIGSVVTGIWAYRASSGSVPTALSAFAASMVVVIAFCGMIALQIENNRYLRQIADALANGASGSGRPSSPAGKTDVLSGRAEPVLKR